LGINGIKGQRAAVFE